MRKYKAIFQVEVEITVPKDLTSHQVRTLDIVSSELSYDEAKTLEDYTGDYSYLTKDKEYKEITKKLVNIEEIKE